MKEFVLIICAIGFLSFSKAQSTVSEEDYIRAVMQYHPLALQANFMESMANAKLLKARGWFDPKINASYDQKTFDGKNYYQIAEGGLKIPTWIGVDLKMNYNWNDGLYLNPESTIPSNGLISAGIELPILQGLIFDKRRADLQQGKNYAQMGALEKEQALNELLYNASQAYWQWFESYRKWQIAKEGVLLAEATFDFVKNSVRLGDKPAIDTLEALIQTQNRLIEQGTAELDYRNSKLWASSFIWLEGSVPGALLDNAFPDNFQHDESALTAYLEQVEIEEDSLVTNNPKLKWYAYKVANLSIEKRLKKEMLKPTLNLGYNFLNQPFQETVLDQFNIGNYKWQVNFTMPLFLRKERGDLKMVKAELDGANAQYANLELQQKNKLEAISNKIEIYQSQLILNEKNIIDNRNLVNGEKRKFEIGESSLFLVNYREISFLKVMQKQAEIQAKLKVAMAELDFAIGR